MENLISASLFSGFESLVKELGGEPKALLNRFGLPDSIESNKDSYVPFSKLARLFDYCAESLSSPDFGLRLASRQGFSVLGPVAVLARNAKTVEEAIRSVRQYLHLISPSMAIELTINPSRQSVQAEFRVNESGLFNIRQVNELYVGNAQLILQMLTESEVYAQCIYLPHSQLADDEVYRSFFHCPVKFNQAVCAAELPLSVLQKQVLGADPETARIANDYLVERFGGRSDLIKDQVEHLISKLLPTGYCRIGVVSDQLNLHQRTLQRRLQDQAGTTFDALVDAQRKLLAKRYLENSSLHLTQITGLLGYADQTALNRSCRRWFKQTPRQLRKSSSSSPD